MQIKKFLCILIPLLFLLADFDARRTELIPASEYEDAEQVYDSDLYLYVQGDRCGLMTKDHTDGTSPDPLVGS